MKDSLNFEHIYYNNGVLKRMSIKRELKEEFLKKFGRDLIFAPEKEVKEWLLNFKTK